MSAAVTASSCSAADRQQPRHVIRCSLPTATVESCSPRNPGSAPGSGRGGRTEGEGAVSGKLLSSSSTVSAISLSQPALPSACAAGGAADSRPRQASTTAMVLPSMGAVPPPPVGEGGRLGDVSARTPQPLLSATAPGKLLALSQPQRLPPRSAQPVGLRASKSLGALAVAAVPASSARVLAAVPQPSPGSPGLRGSVSAATGLHGGLALASRGKVRTSPLSLLEMRPSSHLVGHEMRPLMARGRDGRKLSQFDLWLQPSSGDRATGTTQPTFPPSSQHPIPRLTSRPSSLCTGLAELGATPPRTPVAPLFDVRPPSWGELAGPYAALLAGIKSPSKRGFPSPTNTAVAEGASSEYLSEWGVFP